MRKLQVSFQEYDHIDKLNIFFMWAKFKTDMLKLVSICIESDFKKLNENLLNLKFSDIKSMP